MPAARDGPLATVFEQFLSLQISERQDRLERERAEKEKEDKRKEDAETRKYTDRYRPSGDPLGEQDAFTPGGMAATQSKDLMRAFIPWGDKETQGALVLTYGSIEHWQQLTTLGGIHSTESQ